MKQVLIALILCASVGLGQTTYRGSSATAAADSSYDSLYTAKLRIGTLAGTLRSTNGAAVTATASDTVGLAAALAAKLTSAVFADSARANGIGVGTMATGQFVLARGADTVNSAATWTTATVATRLDTVPIFAFGGGSGAAADTTVFVAGAKMGAFYNKKDTLVITSLNCVMAGDAGDTIDVQVTWDDSLNGVGVKLNTTALGVNSLTTGTADVAFDNAKIPPGVWVWGSTPNVVAAKKPQFLSFVITGCRITP